MPLELIPILALAAMFVAATLLPINMGALGFVAAFFVGTLAVGMGTDAIIAGFPSEPVPDARRHYLLVRDRAEQRHGRPDGSRCCAPGSRARRLHTVGDVRDNRAVDRIGSARAGRRRRSSRPIALGFAKQYRINALLMGMMVIHGAQAGGFSPISIYGVTVNNIVAKAELMNSPLTLFLGSLVFNAAIGVLLFAFLGGRSLIGRTVHDDIETSTETDTDADADGSAAGSPKPDTSRGATPAGNRGATTATVAAPETTGRCQQSRSRSIRCSH